MLLFTAAEVESRGTKFGLSPATSGLLGGMTGGIVQAYATMGTLCYTIVRMHWTEHGNVWLCRLLYLYEDRGDYPSQAGSRWDEAAVDLGCLRRHLQAGGYCRYQQGRQCCCIETNDQLGIAVGKITLSRRCKIFIESFLFTVSALLALPKLLSAKPGGSLKMTN